MQDQALDAVRSARRLGLMGGTFDPIHNEHISLARTALEQFSLDAVLFLVAGDPPHKRISANEQHRFEMAKLALAGEDRMFASSIELNRSRTTYTVDTLKLLKKELPQAELYYIVGEDTLIALQKGWKNVQEVYGLTRFICFGRLGYDSKEIDPRMRVEFAKKQPTAVSSTSIRNRISQELPVEGELPKAVFDYIRRHGLYARECMTFDEAKDMLHGIISEQRYVHTMLVVQTAELLARQYGENTARARWAALLHDCAKGLSYEESLTMAANFHVALDEVTRNEPDLLHAPLGAVLAKEVFSIDDEQVLSAIRCHTTGRANMTLLDKILYISDAIEPNRDYEGVLELRRLVFEDLDKAVLEYTNNSIAYIVKTGRLLHRNTVDARNDMVLQLYKNQNKRRIEYDG
ncbi:MAG: nicotinate-nucleotide adenylyltransferase [Christensenellales bacterium]|jgi:nicotinate-nucleotide adenylyltransferase